MSEGPVLYALEDDVATVTMNRPAVLNGLSADMRAGLVSAIARAEGEARVLVLTGAGRAFCSGQDLSQRRDPASVDLESLLVDEYLPLVHALAEARIPTIAAVNGVAAGAGANLALAADIVIARESAYFLQAFARIGLIPDAGGTYWLPRTMGLAKALGAALLAEPVSATDAAAWGMIWEAVPDREFGARVTARASQLAAGPTEAYGRIKSVLRASLGRDLAGQLALEAAEQGAAGRSADYREGVTAFLEKRRPVFRGR